MGDLPLLAVRRIMAVSTKSKLLRRVKSLGKLGGKSPTPAMLPPPAGRPRLNYPSPFAGIRLLHGTANQALSIARLTESACHARGETQHR